MLCDDWIEPDLPRWVPPLPVDDVAAFLVRGSGCTEELTTVDYQLEVRRGALIAVVWGRDFGATNYRGETTGHFQTEAVRALMADALNAPWGD